MMKYLLTVLLLNVLLISTSQARNCAQAVHNPHCSASSGNSGQQSQGPTVIGSTGKTPDPAQTNTHLGTGSATQQPVVQINPIVPHHIVGQAQAPVKPVMNIPPKAIVTAPPLLPNKTPMMVPSQPTVNKPPLAINPKPPLNIYMVPSKVITGTSAVPQQVMTTAPPKTFTSPPQQQVYPVPGKVTTGTSAVPQQVITTAPPKTFTSPPQQQVHPVPGKVITGTSAVPQQQVYPVPTPIMIGQASVPVKPVVTSPPKQSAQTPSQLPNNVPPLIAPTKPNTVKPVLITHVASSNLHPDVLLQQQMLHSGANLKSLESHIKDLPVDVYTDKNVRKMTYKESKSTDSKGFHLTVVGVKEAAVIDTSPLPVSVKPDDIIFNFGFASAEIHKDQLSQVDEIISKHSKNGKKIILMGETDGFGSEAYNKHLAILRANKIIDALKARGVKIDDVEIRILVRCCRKDHPTKDTLAETSEQRITWVHFQ